MKIFNLSSLLLRLTISTLFLIIISCAKTEEGKIPITTSSNEALKYYLQGRALAEKLRGQESIQFFEKAIAEDTNFAMGYMNLSFVVPSAKEFFEN